VRYHNNGFSLLEVLLALLILGIGFVGVLEGITMALHSSKGSERQTTAVLLAVGHMEELCVERLLSESEEEGDFGEEFPAYSWSETINETSHSGLFEVTVTVSLTSTDQIIYELKTLLFDDSNGLNHDLQGDQFGRQDSQGDNNFKRGQSR